MNKNANILTLTGAALLLLAGCTDPEPPPTQSLLGPSRIAFGKVCLVGDAAPRRRLPAEACDDAEGAGQTRVLIERGYVTNQLGDTVATINFNLEIPKLIDTRPDIPGVTHIPVGRRPSELVVSLDGNFVFTFNQVDQDISVIAEDLQREVARIPVGAPVAGLFAARNSRDVAAEALWLLLPDEARIVEVAWSFKCNGAAEYVEGCQPELTFETRTLYQFSPGSLPRHATLSATADSLLVTFGKRASMAEVLMSTGRGGATDTRACLDGGQVPCVARRIGLTFGCSDGLDNDGDGRVDAADPQCLDPRSAESTGGIGRTRPGACDDGLDNDGDDRVDAADEGCAFAGDDSELGAVRPVACSDGVDNDNDGLTDGDDLECALGPWHRSEAALPACSDGADNDDDGLTDGEDPQCTSTLQDDEASRPGCNDGQDNDDDGLIDLDDLDCASPLGDDEGPASAACNDGVDNDLDGAVDLDDPACAGLSGSSEADAVRPCNDGVDNDGDGLTDYPADPDCYGASGAGEASFAAFEFGPIAVDPKGRFAYVIDRVEGQLLIVDLDRNALLDPNDCDPADTDCRRRPFNDDLGVPVGTLPRSIAARRLEISNRDSPSAPGSDLPGRFKIITEQAFAVVATARGSAFFVNAAQVIRTFDNGQLIEEVVDPIARLADGQPTAASASTVLCDQDLARELLGANATCDDPALPRLAPPDTLCDPAQDANCECQTEDGQEICLLTAPIVQMVSRAQQVFDFSEAEPFDVVQTTEGFSDDFFAVDDNWSVTFEGLLTSSASLIVDEGSPGVLRATSGDFCAADLRPGDLLTVTSSITPVPGIEPDCADFADRDLSWRVDRVNAGQLTISPVDADLAALLRRPDDALPLVEVLPRRACFAAGLRVEVRPVQQWIISGERTGVLSNQISLGGVCAPRFDTFDLNSRINTGETFSNPFFSFQLVGGTNPVPRGFSLNFSTARRFGASQLSAIGPSPDDMGIFETRRRVALPILDTGSDLIRVFDANTNRAITVLF